MIESMVLGDPVRQIGARMGAAGLGLAVAGQQAGAAPPVPQPAASPGQQVSPFDRRDLVEIRGNIRPLAPEASVALGAADEEGGGAPEPGQEGGLAQRRARLLADAFAPREPESFLGRVLDLAA